jgi:PKD repeat protein
MGGTQTKNKGKILIIALVLAAVISVSSMALAAEPEDTINNLLNTQSLNADDTTGLDSLTISDIGLGPVTAAFNAKVLTSKAPFNVSFTDKSTGPVGSWSWDFGDGNTSTLQNITHSYAAAGKYNVTLTVADQVGINSNTTTKVITVEAPKSSSSSKPCAAFTSSVCGKTVKFTDKSSGSPTCWSWNFGDKCTSTSKSPSHTYSKAGKYKVTLTAKNSKGSSTTSNTVTVK